MSTSSKERTLVMVVCFMVGLRLVFNGKHLSATLNLQSPYTKHLYWSQNIPQQDQQNIPHCAKGLVLHTNKSSSQGEEDCYGFLIQDNMLLTTRDCEEIMRTTYGSTNLGNKESAITNTTSPKMTNSSNTGSTYYEDNMKIPNLVMVNLDLPTYHRNSGWPRQRMFLDRRNSSRDAFTTLGISCTGNKPVLSALSFKDGQLFPVSIEDQCDTENAATLNRVLWNEKNMDNATREMCNDIGERWWVKKQSEESLMKEMDQMYNKYYGPTGTLNVMDAAGRRAVLQAEDPMGGRVESCLNKYLIIWEEEKPFSGEPFFEWLDFGAGRMINLHTHDSKGFSCLRKHQHQFRRKWFNETERENLRVDVKTTDNGKSVRLIYRNSQKPVPHMNTDMVWGLDDEIYVIDRESYDTWNHAVGHTSIFSAGPVKLAGGFWVGKKGKLNEIDLNSGHYKPRAGGYNIKLFQKFIMDLGVTPEAIEWPSEEE